MSSEALREAVELFESLPVDHQPDGWPAVRMGDITLVVQALRDQEAEIARLREQAAMSMGVGTGDGQLFVYGSYESIKAAQAIVFRAEQAESALATHRANYDALVIRLGEVTARLEAADGLLRDCISDDAGAEHFLGADLLARITTHLKAADHG